VVGVAPEGFNGASIIGSDVWAPLSMQEQWSQGHNFLGAARVDPMMALRHS
jgi:hypothetical protein